MIVLYNTTLLRIVTLGSRWVVGIALFPFVLCRSDARGKASTTHLINHERIHLRQQAELLLLGFCLWYAIDYLRHRISGLDHMTAYRSIIFEREAYAHGDDPGYLKRRKLYAFLRA